MAQRPRGMDPAGQRSRPGDLTLGSSIGRRPPRPDRSALVGSVVFHVILLGALVVGAVWQRVREPEFVAYRVKLISPPPQVRAEQPTPVRTPEPRIVRPPEPERRVETPRPTQPEVKRPERTPVADTTPKPKEPEPVAGAKPDPESTGGADVNVNIEGQEFPFPDYLDNIILQINRYFRWEGSGSPTATVSFYINRDGSAGGIGLVERSRDLKFNFEAMAAIEQAGKRGAFGALPDGWVPDRLWVRYKFLPPGGMP
jgi:outer membrane biosynthesis protein TonB